MTRIFVNPGGGGAVVVVKSVDGSSTYLPLNKPDVLAHCTGPDPATRQASGCAWLRGQLLAFLGADVFAATILGMAIDLATGVVKITATCG